jgi:hypothetical protein
MKIDVYDFGKIIIDGTTYSKDLIVFPDHIEENWWRKSGHNLVIEDLKDVIKVKPDKLFIGTGKFGFVKVKDDVIKHLNSIGVDVFIGKTDDAIKAYNSESHTNKVGAFHLTC